MPEPEVKGNPRDRLPHQAERMIREVHAKQESLKRSEAHKETFWSSVAMLGVIGWSVALPSLAGVALGLWIDHRWPSRISWAAVLFASGLAYGCAAAWNHMRGTHR